jgi:hypothetical protein
MATLISAAYAKQALQAEAEFSSAEDDIIDDLIAGVGNAIERYCKRQFDSQTFDELYDGGSDEILLRQYPVQGITSVRCNPTPVLEVQNTLTSTNQQALIEVRATLVALTKVASGSSSTDTTAVFATYPTLAALATQITAVGSGWTARAVGSATGDYGLWPSADLYIPPYLGDGIRSMGNLNARGRYAQLLMHTGFLDDYAWDPSGRIYHMNATTWPQGLAGWDESSRAFPGSRGYYRIKYTAGYTTVPEDIQIAAAMWVARLFFAWKRDPAAQNSSSFQFEGSSSSTSYAQPRGMPDEVKALVDPYRKRFI